jgi:(4-alkanoyl-5-oxo-2,5-dihydrofuran-3-yl)methyl phosphate reductase
MILITGATGNVGSELIAALLPAQAGHIRVLTCNPGAVFPDGTQTAVADLGESDLAPAIDGVHAVFLLTDGLHIAAHDQRLTAAAPRAGVERIVKLSVRNVGHDATDPITRSARPPSAALDDPSTRPHRALAPARKRAHTTPPQPPPQRQPPHPR